MCACVAVQKVKKQSVSEQESVLKFNTVPTVVVCCRRLRKSVTVLDVIVFVKKKV